MPRQPPSLVVVLKEEDAAYRAVLSAPPVSSSSPSSSPPNSPRSARVVFLPCLTVAVNKGVLNGAFSTDSIFPSIIITSKRAVTALREEGFVDCVVTSLLSHEADGLHVYVVGPATRDAVTALLEEALHQAGLSLTICGESSGTASALAAYIQSEADPKIPLWWAAGEDRRNELPTMLETSGHMLTTVVVYKAEASASVQAIENVAGEMLGERRSAVVLYSKHGIAVATELLGRVQRGGGDAMLITVGPTTAGSARDAGLTVDAVAGTPTAEGVIAAMGL